MGGQQVHEVQIGGLSGSLNSINSMRLEKVQISDKLVKGVHVTIKFWNLEILKVMTKKIQCFYLEIQIFLLVKNKVVVRVCV